MLSEFDWTFPQDSMQIQRHADGSQVSVPSNAIMIGSSPKMEALMKTGEARRTSEETLLALDESCRP